jgi:integrase
VSKSNTKSRPRKPRKDFPLSCHATGRWAKKVRGRFCYFSKIETDPKGEAALKLWLDQKDELLAGRKPRSKVGDGKLTVAELCNHFLTSKVNRLQAGELSPATFADCKETCDRIVRVFGKSRGVEDLASDDFAALRADIAKHRNPESVGNEINRVRGVFKYGWDNRLISAPVNFGTEFARPRRRILRGVRNSRPEKFFEAAEIRAMVDAAGPQMRAMLLLAVNDGMGNSDVANLPLSALDLQAGWLEFPRPKTGIKRRIALWTETVEALKAWLPMRPTPRDERHADLVFVTSHRGSWSKDAAEFDTSNGMDDLQRQCRKSSDNPISKEMRKLLNTLGIKRAGVSFYSLRHVFETVGGESRDQVAVDFIMGHGDESMSARYRERISDDRLRAVTAHVRTWLFSEQPSDADAIEADDDKTAPATTTEAK